MKIRSGNWKNIIAGCWRMDRIVGLMVGWYSRDKGLAIRVVMIDSRYIGRLNTMEFINIETNYSVYKRPDILIILVDIVIDSWVG